MQLDITSQNYLRLSVVLDWTSEVKSTRWSQSPFLQLQYLHFALHVSVQRKIVPSCLRSPRLFCKVKPMQRPSEEILQEARNGTRTKWNAYRGPSVPEAAEKLRCKWKFPSFIMPTDCTILQCNLRLLLDSHCKWLYYPPLYCDISTRCGEPGWTRAAFINMTDGSQSCPNELAEMNYTGIKVCKRRAHNACDSVNFIAPVSYTKLCGRIIGYQIGTSDAFCAFQNYCDYTTIFTILTELTPLTMSMLMV